MLKETFFQAAHALGPYGWKGYWCFGRATMTAFARARLVCNEIRAMNYRYDYRWQSYNCNDPNVTCSRSSSSYPQSLRLLTVGWTQAAGISGTLQCFGKPFAGAILVLHDGSTVMATASTTGTGAFNISGTSTVMNKKDKKDDEPVSFTDTNAEMGATGRAQGNASIIDALSNDTYLVSISRGQLKLFLSKSSKSGDKKKGKKKRSKSKTKWVQGKDQKGESRMVRLRFSGQCLLLVILFTRCFAQNDMNDMLLPDRELSGPGVLARLTPGGTSYVSAVVARALAHEIPLSRIPGQINSTRLKSLPTVTLSDLRLNVFQLPATFNVAPVSPNIVAVSLRNTILSLGAYGTGRIDQVPVDSRMDIKTWQLALQVSIKINRNNRGNPRLTVDTCRVPERIPVTVAVVKALTPETGAKLANSIAEEGHLLFEQMICSRLVHIMENRINQRFTLLASKITLGETNNFDLVRNILSSARAAVPLQRPRPVPSPRTVLRNPARQLVHRRQSVEGGIQRRPVQLHLGASDQQRMFRRHADAEKIHAAEPLRIKRQAEQGDFHAFLSSFNLSRADSLLLDYGMVSIPIISPRGIEIAQVGEITANGGHTPFGPRPAFLPPTPSTSAMLQIVVSDFVPNTLMYHGHRIGLFNTRVDPNTPQFGPVMRTTCDLSTGSLFCVGDLFPTLREMVPDRGIAFLFSTLKAPAVLVHPEAQGGIKFQLLGLIEILSLEAGGAERRVGSMEIHIDATMKMKLSSKIVRGKVNLENIKLITRTPNILAQDELDDAGFLSREILQRMVNDILKQGVPIPVHPLFKLQKPKLTLLKRSMLLETNFELKDKLIHQLTTQHLVA